MVRLGRDAVRPVPRAVRERRSASSAASRRTSSARRSTRRAAGSTRCSRSRRCCSIARRTRTSSASATSATSRTARCRSRWGTSSRPWEVLDRYGADAFRWYFFTSKQPWDGYRFSIDAVGEGVRLFLKQLWNTYTFHVLYENAAAAQDPATRPGRCRERARPLDPLTPRGDRRGGHRAARRASTRPPPAARSPRSSTISRTGTCAARAGASGRATRPRSRRCASASS